MATAMCLLVAPPARLLDRLTKVLFFTQRPLAVGLKEERLSGIAPRPERRWRNSVSKENTVIHPTAVVEENVFIGQGVRIWHFAHVRRNVILEDGVSLGKDVFVDEGLCIRKGSRIQNGVSLYRGVNIAPYCFVGPHVIFTNDHSPRAGTKNWLRVETHLESGASVGAGSVILCGVRLGSFSLVGAGAIVTKDVLPFHLAVGFPAVHIKKVCACAKTLFSLEVSHEQLVSKCCFENMETEAFELARDSIEQLKQNSSLL